MKYLKFFLIMFCFICFYIMILKYNEAIHNNNITKNNYNLIILNKNKEINRLYAENDKLFKENIEVNTELEILKNEKEAEITELLLYIEPLKKYNKTKYLNQYKAITNDNILNYMNEEEFTMLCKVIQAESGICNFDGKVNVANTIINRYYSNLFPNNWIDILTQKNQYSVISNGTYKTINITEETITALEYAMLIGDTTNGCLYFHSNSANLNWDGNKLKKEMSDNWHTFYKQKGENIKR